MVMRSILFLAALALAGCNTVPTMTPEQLQAMAADKSTVV